MTSPIRYGLLGASQIARNAHILGIRGALTNSRLLGIASRGAAKATAWAGEFGIPRPYGSYEDLLADPEIDAVLISLPVHAHAEWVIKAAAAGKHVLCEKPMASSVTELEAMIVAAHTHGVVVMEAFSHRFPPHLPYVKELIDRGEIGAVKLVRAEVIYPTTDWANDSRANPDLGGCVTVECGCYAANTLLYFLGDDPVEVSAYATRRQPCNVDATVTGILRFPGGRLGQITASMETRFRACAEIIGDGGRIEMPNLFTGREVRVLRLGRPDAEVISFDVEDRFVTQIRHFSDCLLNGTPPRVSLDESLATTRLLMRLKAASSGDRSPVPVST